MAAAAVRRPRPLGHAEGAVYGTILIDLERGTVLDLLLGRGGEAVKRWLAANPQVEVITRYGG